MTQRKACSHRIDRATRSCHSARTCLPAALIRSTRCSQRSGPAASWRLTLSTWAFRAQLIWRGCAWHSFPAGATAARSLLTLFPPCEPARLKPVLTVSTCSCRAHGPRDFFGRWMRRRCRPTCCRTGTCPRLGLTPSPTLPSPSALVTISAAERVSSGIGLRTGSQIPRTSAGWSACPACKKTRSRCGSRRSGWSPPVPCGVPRRRRPGTQPTVHTRMRLLSTHGASATTSSWAGASAATSASTSTWRASRVRSGRRPTLSRTRAVGSPSRAGSAFRRPSSSRTSSPASAVAST
mmetsp:Transcript_17547/g.57463  ORF Transcript_17547/g.57463 Transcript_17547/m.57463 type:complete len:294 (-) Transcript_17547:502-1383(-)